MKWSQYKELYLKLARLQEKSEEYCIKQLEYAKRLFDADLPVIYSQKHLCYLVGFSQDYLTALSNSPDKFYYSFSIPKRNGKDRSIHAPLPNLKEIQRWILDEILDKVTESSYSKAFRLKYSIKDNARFHRRQVKVLSMDLKDFFSTIKFGRVLKLFRELGYKESVAVMLANICCLDGAIPQGAPTSPKIANLIARDLDNEIWAYIKEQAIRYTRYADDLTFSGNFQVGALISKVTYLAKKNGFSINSLKTKVMGRNNRQMVTGIVVNEKMQVPRRLRRILRLQAYYIQKYGVNNHKEHVNEKHSNYLYHLIGLASFAVFVNPHDDSSQQYLDIFKKELSRVNN